MGTRCASKGVRRRFPKVGIEADDLNSVSGLGWHVSSRRRPIWSVASHSLGARVVFVHRRRIRPEAHAATAAQQHPMWARENRSGNCRGLVSGIDQAERDRQQRVVGRLPLKFHEPVDQLQQALDDRVFDPPPCTSESVTFADRGVKSRVGCCGYTPASTAPPVKSSHTAAADQ